MHDQDPVEKLRTALAEEILGAATAAADIGAKHGFTLDFTERSLNALDDYLSELAADLTPPQKENAAQLFDAYVLEVARRVHGGYFQRWDERRAIVLVTGAPVCRIALLAADKVRGRLSGLDDDSLSFLYAGFAERALARRPGDDATYV